MKNDIAVKTELGREVYRVSLNKFLDTLNSYKSSKLVDFRTFGKHFRHPDIIDRIRRSLA